MAVRTSEQRFTSSLPVNSGSAPSNRQISEQVSLTLMRTQVRTYVVSGGQNGLQRLGRAARLRLSENSPDLIAPQRFTRRALQHILICRSASRDICRDQITYSMFR